MHEWLEIWKKRLLEGMNEDSWTWDFTTWGALGASRGVADQKIEAEIVAKSSGIWAGESGVQALLSIAKELNSSLKVKKVLRDGTLIKNGDVVLSIQGSARLILALERPYLNLASFVSGISSLTRLYVEEISEAARAKKIKKIPRLSPTRKTLPGYRDLSILGVLIGGGSPHRMSLSGGVLIKENHLRLQKREMEEIISDAKAIAPHGLKIEIEVTNLKEMKTALSSGAEVIMLDNFSPEEVKKALIEIENFSPAVRPLIEVSGGVKTENVGEYVMDGVDLISVGSLTHSVTALDLSLLVKTKKSKK